MGGRDRDQLLPASPTKKLLKLYIKEYVSYVGGIGKRVAV
jgi:hypothetical protein